MADKDGKCWPSQASIAQRCGIARETVNRRVGILVEAGLVRVERRFNAKGRAANLYLVGCVTSDHPPVSDVRSQTPVTSGHSPPVSDVRSHREIIEIFPPVSDVRSHRTVESKKVRRNPPTTTHTPTK